MRIRNIEENSQNMFLLVGVNFFDAFLVLILLRSVRATIENNRATTPPSLFGIERKIA